MNGEEGELRPQLLDRFGLHLALDGQPEPAQRMEIVRRRLAFDADPQAFAVTWRGEQDELRQRCTNARERLAGIPLDEATLMRIAERCFAAAVDGLRADLVWLRAARAHAAWRGAEQIDEADIDAVADFVLRHRRCHLETPPTAQQPQPAQSHNESADGQWGALPPQPQAMGERREPPRWSKKP
ncbi:Magnesium-chelatase 38 kDa subunit [compost metagenome]